MHVIDGSNSLSAFLGIAKPPLSDWEFVIQGELCVQEWTLNGVSLHIG
jgi:hypothetical protein